jgi:hypothetical protein
MSLTLDLISAPKPETAPLFLRFTAIKRFERVEDPTGLAPKGRFIAAEAIECEIDTAASNAM